MHEINERLKKSFINEKRLICGWYIVDHGWEINLRCMIVFTEKLQIKMVLNQKNNTVLVIFMDENRTNGRRRVYDI